MPIDVSLVSFYEWLCRAQKFARDAGLNLRDADVSRRMRASFDAGLDPESAVTDAYRFFTQAQTE